MASVDLPVVVEVARPDGSQELVRVGTARRDGGCFVLDLGALRISSTAAPFAAPTASPPAQGGTIEDLEYIAARARRTLADASKSRWHSQERDLLEQVEREMLRLKGLERPD
ncbi:MAG: hypothetical protein H6Q89_3627 [Myxococcaceae bacterium]|nr:hypothetical protein [Myxococcaceae bacterium]